MIGIILFLFSLAFAWTNSFFPQLFIYIFFQLSAILNVEPEIWKLFVFILILVKRNFVVYLLQLIFCIIYYIYLHTYTCISSPHFEEIQATIMGTGRGGTCLSYPYPAFLWLVKFWIPESRVFKTLFIYFIYSLLFSSTGMQYNLHCFPILQFILTILRDRLNQKYVTRSHPANFLEKMDI